MADIYRHPKRQGLQLDERYNMKHDIYSLGVCLLEIGLWEPFIVENGQGNAKFISDTYCKKAVSSGHVPDKDSNNIRTLTRPATVVKEVMTALAKDIYLNE